MTLRVIDRWNAQGDDREKGHCLGICAAVIHGNPSARAPPSVHVGCLIDKQGQERLVW
jgi:hypothetical protein